MYKNCVSAIISYTKTLYLYTKIYIYITKITACLSSHLTLKPVENLHRHKQFQTNTSSNVKGQSTIRHISTVDHPIGTLVHISFNAENLAVNGTKSRSFSTLTSH